MKKTGILVVFAFAAVVITFIFGQNILADTLKDIAEDSMKFVEIVETDKYQLVNDLIYSIIASISVLGLSVYGAIKFKKGYKKKGFYCLLLAGISFLPLGLLIGWFAAFACLLLFVAVIFALASSNEIPFGFFPSVTFMAACAFAVVCALQIGLGVKVPDYQSFGLWVGYFIPMFLADAVIRG